MNWDDPRLQVASDTAWRKKYRRLQSWYREMVLCARPGLGDRKSEHADEPVGSMLAEEDVALRPSLNFLSEEIATYATARAAVVQKQGGTIELDRLKRNLLSSMPMCFNLFGHLRLFPREAAVVLREVLELDIVKVTRIEVEESPPPHEHLGDRTAFDAFVEYETSKGEMGFVGIETKYTEPFSATDYSARRTIYAERTADPSSGFRPGAAERLRGAATNQLWRNALLAQSLQRRQRYACGHVAVLACRGDAGASRALAGLCEQHNNPESLLRDATLEDLLAACARHDALLPWVQRFRERYLDLSPVCG